tara:strand:- start:717 stop:1085 length:369 start_codon:yes stop_codon:yes gene_type:complete
MSRQLTENQQNFLEVLFDQAAGDVVLAKKLSGYSDNTPTRIIVESLKEEILDATRSYFARTAPLAAFALGNVINDPTELGIKEKMVAAKDLLDRAGLIKTDKVDIQTSNGVFYLPPKEGSNE